MHTRTSKQTIVILLFMFIFINLGFLEFVKIHHDSMNGITPISHNKCIASLTQGSECPKNSNPIPFIVYHIETFKNLFIASVEAITFSSILGIIILLIGIAYLLLHLPLYRVPISLGCHYYDLHSLNFSKRKQRAWLTLLEESPPYLKVRCS